MGKLQLQYRVQLVVAVLCFALAGLVWALTRHGSPGGIGEVPIDDLTWTLCLACGTSEQMPVRDFLVRQQQEILETRNSLSVPMIVCSHCGKKQVVRAMKCEHCGTVFAEGGIPGDYYDRCPQCQFSALENRRAEAASKP